MIVISALDFVRQRRIVAIEGPIRMAAQPDVILIDTPVFFDVIRKYIDSNHHWSLQEALIRNPEKGAIIKGSGGIRKLRWAIPGKGKSGGLRIIYHWDPSDRRLFFLYCYPKSRQGDLTPAQIKALKAMLEANQEE